MIDGVINIYKEKGYTSHDVVAKMRGILKQKKIGHTGTLDPDATGVLPVCLGKGTRLCDFLTDKTKVYEAVLLLGQETDTQDTSGQVLDKKEVTVTEAEVKAAVLSFIGDYHQIPPMYSAIKQDGRKLYELAREGRTVERQPRQVYIHQIEILSLDLPRVRMQVTCSKGTYIRTLCHDVGKALGCGGCMEELVRTRSGVFLIEESVTLSRLEEIRNQDRLRELVIPVEQVLHEYPAAAVTAAGEKLLYNGNALSDFHLEEGQTLTAQEGIRIYDAAGRFIALYRYDYDKKKFKPLKMFYGGI